MKHDGFANFETWCVNMWLNNEESSYKFWLDAARAHLKDAPHSRHVAEGILTIAQTARCKLAEQLKDSLEEENPLREADIYSDLLCVALAEVEWHEIADEFLEGFQPALVEPESDAPEQLDACPLEPGGAVIIPPAKKAETPAKIVAAIDRHDDISELLTTRRQIAIVWSIEDVQSVRPDLNDDQAWEVLQRCEKRHDCNYGLTWSFMEDNANDLFPSDRESDLESRTR